METILQPNLKSIVDFVRLNTAQQVTVLLQEAILLDIDTEKVLTTRLYLYKGFFVEETFNRVSNEIVDIIPFKQGYRIKDYIKNASSSLAERPYYFQYCIN
ncbi:hypothetical protein [Aurantibacillus circumpalustris]|uniref:hypothetical protein n=1 Tax=Aurantibacillus circumpalustris TaxID=3036359 RepID=UPI00295B6E38|nr:hypothetical protein [Aurantibacillus circumpalustris]